LAKTRLVGMEKIEQFLPRSPIIFETPGLPYLDTRDLDLLEGFQAVNSREGGTASLVAEGDRTPSSRVEQAFSKNMRTAISSH